MKFVRAAVLFTLVLAFFSARSMLAQGQYGYTETTLYSFCQQGGTSCTDGSAPVGPLVQATNATFYGMTQGGGAHGWGTIFSYSSSVGLTTLYSFCSQGGANCTDGQGPDSGLLLASDGSLYGTTRIGGAGEGVVFHYVPGGAYSVLYTFCNGTGASCPDGAEPAGNLVQDTEGNLYGITVGGGLQSSSCPTAGCGTVFTISSAGVFSTLFQFCTASCFEDGAVPDSLAFVNGALLGTTVAGGYDYNSICTEGLGCGTLYSLTTTGQFRLIHDFCAEQTSNPNDTCLDGGEPSLNGLGIDSSGNFYGTTLVGFAPGEGSGGGYFEIVNGKGLTYMPACNNDPCPLASPTGGMVLGLYGTMYNVSEFGGNFTAACGSNGCGAVSALMAAFGGAVEPFYTFCPTASPYCDDGMEPTSPPINAMDNNLYGVTSLGGTQNGGVLYRINVPARTATSLTLAVSPSSFYSGQETVLETNLQPQSASNLNGLTSISVNGTAVLITSAGGGTVDNHVDTGNMAAGTFSVTAAYEGNGLYAPSTSAPTSVTILRAPTATTLTVTPTTFTPPHSVVVTTTVNRNISGNVGFPNGNVTLFANGSALATAPVGKNGSTTFDYASTKGLAPGTYQVKAVYDGTTGNSPSQSATVTVTVQ